jgi:acyl-CoA thioesterase
VSDAPATPDGILDGMYAADRVAQVAGMRVVEAEAGFATVEMTVREEMTNGLGVCHGGLVFTLADTAMAYASNAGDDRALSTSASIEWIRSASEGDRLRATCRTVVRRGRSAIHDIVVVDGDGETVALVRGHTLAVADRAT